MYVCMYVCIYRHTHIPKQLVELVISGPTLQTTASEIMPRISRDQLLQLELILRYFCNFFLFM